MIPLRRLLAAAWLLTGVSVAAITPTACAPSDTCPAATASGWSPSWCGAYTSTGTGKNFGSGPVSSFAECATSCSSLPLTEIMFFGPDLYSPGTHECECVSGIEPASTVSPSCTTPGQYQWYIRAAPEPAQPEASLTRKRRQEAVVRRAAEQDTTLCPSTLTPCRIKGSDDGWECIDTQTELESCGGCRHGVFTTSKIQKTAVLPARLQRRQPTLSLPSSAAAGLLSVGVDCSDRRRFGPGLTCRKGVCAAM